jgi:hypothetical protein
MRIGRLYCYALVAFLGFGTGFPLVVTLLGRAELPWTEKRRIASMPALPGTLAALEGFPPEFEAFWNDVFGLRKELLKIDFAITTNVFGQMSTGKVIKGRDGWLFYTGDRSLDLYRRALPLGAGELSVLGAERRRRSDRLAEMGIAYLMTIAPDKHTIHPELMPKYLRRRVGPSQFDQVANAMKAAGAPFLDLRPPLLEAQRHEETYFRLDTHWNVVGAYVAHVAILEALGRKPVPRPLFLEGEKKGDLAIMAGLNEVERAPALPPAGVGACDPLIASSPDTNASRRYYCKGARGRLLIYADSFGENLIPWLSRSFAESTFAGPAPLWKDLLADVERERPDVVIEMRVERRAVDLVEASARSVE